MKSTEETDIQTPPPAAATLETQGKQIFWPTF